MEEKIKKIALLQYCLMEENQDFSEAGKDRVRIDFARHLLKLPPSYQISTLDLDRFDKLTKQDLDPHAETKKLLHELRGEENVIIANRKQGFPLVLYGPITTFKKAGCTIHILEKEIARTPTAVLAIAAFTKQEKEIVIRKEALEHVFWRKWAASEDFKFKKLVLSLYGIKSREDLETKKELFIQEMLETTIMHEICHTVVSGNFKDQDLYIFGKMLDAYLPQTTTDVLNELLAEWEPEHGAIPYLAKLAQKDHTKAQRMFHRYLADAWFSKNSDQRFLFEYTKLLATSLKPYIQASGKVNFEQITKDAPQIYAKFLNQLEKLLRQAHSKIKSSTFEFNGLLTDFFTLAKTQHKRFKEQNTEHTPDSAMYKRYFWANMSNYLKNCSEDSFSEIKEMLQTR